MKTHVNLKHMVKKRKEKKIKNKEVNVNQNYTLKGVNLFDHLF